MSELLGPPYDVVVVGAGPAGLAAALAAEGHGARIAVVDALPRAGGQVWRHDVQAPPTRDARNVLTAFDRAVATGRIDWLAGTTVIGVDAGALLVEGPRGGGRIGYDALVLATGARELLLPFPGWTLPGVTGAGGAQALAKQGWPLAGRRVVLAGSGPLLIAAAATLRARGAKVLGIFEQAPWQSVARFAAGLARWPGKAVDALALRARLVGVRYRTGALVRSVDGDDHVRAVRIEDEHGRHEHLDCDHVAVGWGLVPSVELARMLGCRLERDGVHARVAADVRLETSIAGVYAAGEACGIGGRDAALLEGAMAGHAAAGAEARARALSPARERARRFARELAVAFALGPRVRTLATPRTIVCRCEDVRLAALADFAGLREAKLATRCGMGPCQGRICHPALAELGLDASRDDDPDGGPRPPLVPTRLDTLAEALDHDSRGIQP